MSVTRITFSGAVEVIESPNLNIGDVVEVTARGHVDSVASRESYRADQGPVLTTGVTLETIEEAGFKFVRPAPLPVKRVRFYRQNVFYFGLWVGAGIEIVLNVVFSK